MTVDENKILKINSLQQKHDYEFRWNQTTGFVPAKGEIIVYDAEVDGAGNLLVKEEDFSNTGRNVTGAYTSPRFKIGDGETDVKNLDFVSIGAEGTGKGSEKFNFMGNVASGEYSHAEGYNTTASADYSHASGQGTKATAPHQTVIGKYNDEDENQAFIIGWGESPEEGSNIATVDTDGNAVFKGTVKVTPNELNVATEKYVDDAIADLDAEAVAGVDGITFIEYIVENNGIITASTGKVREGTTDDMGIVLLDNIASSVETTAATPKAIKDAIDALYAPDPDASGTATAFIATASEERGVIKATKARLPEASTDNKGIVQLYDDLDGTSTSTAATANAVREAYDTACSTHYITTGRKKGTTVGTKSTAEGYNTTASAFYTHAEGNNTIASGTNSHAEGEGTTASGRASHAEGSLTSAKSNYSHAEGYSTTASGGGAHAEGYKTEAGGVRLNAEETEVYFGEYSHAEGYESKALARQSHAEGLMTQAGSVNLDSEGMTEFTQYGSVSTSGSYAHSEGRYTTAIGTASHIEGYSSNKCDYDNRKSNEEIISTWSTAPFSLAKGNYSHVEGYDCLTLGESAHAEGNNTIASGDNAHAEGSGTAAIGYYSHSEGYGTTAVGRASHIEGASTILITYDNNASNEDIISDWENTDGETPTGPFSLAKGAGSHVEGTDCLALNTNAHAEGFKNIASGMNSHAEGYGVDATGACAHAEGELTHATNSSAHAEGYLTYATGDSSHAEGCQTHAEGKYSHASGLGTYALAEAEFVIGKYNLYNNSTKDKDIAFVIGNGTNANNTSNAATIDTHGNAWFAGTIKIGSPLKDVATTDDIVTAINNINVASTTIAGIPDQFIYSISKSGGTITASKAYLPNYAASDKRGGSAKSISIDDEPYSVSFDSGTKTLTFSLFEED